MPIHLPPLSRRQFLSRSALATAGVALSRDVFAANKPADPHTWALLSDPHIDANPGLVARGVNMADHLTKVANEVIALPARPANVLINGDCAYLKGEPGDYETFAALIQPIRAAQMPIHLTLGNHDHREHFWDGLGAAGETERPVADRHVALVKSERANWLLLDSLDKVNVTPGILGEAQLAWLGKTLDANADKPAIICAHHNPQSPEVKGALLDWEKLIAVLAPRRHVKAFIFGHTHDWSVTTHLSGIHFINLPPIAYVFKTGKPNGWVHASVRTHGVQLKLNCLDRTHAAHGETKELKWRS